MKKRILHVVLTALSFLGAYEGRAKTVNWLMQDLFIASFSGVGTLYPGGYGPYINTGFQVRIDDKDSATVEGRRIGDIEDSMGLGDATASRFEISSGSEWLLLSTDNEGGSRYALVQALSNAGNGSRYGIVKLHKTYAVGNSTEEHVFLFPVGQCGDVIGADRSVISATYSVLLFPWDGDSVGTGTGVQVTQLINIDEDELLKSTSDDSSMIWERFDYSNRKHYHYYARNNSPNVRCIKTTMTSGKLSGSIRTWNFFAPRPPETLSACANFKATDSEIEKVVCTWSAVVGATKYKIFRDGVLVGSSSACSFTDTQMECDTQYSYSVVPVKQENGVDVATGPERSDPGMAVSPGPDLVVSGSFSPQAIYRSQNVSLSLTVRNAGSVNAGASVVWIQIGNALWCRDVPALSPGAASTQTYQLAGSMFSPGTYTVKLVADGNRTIVESDENNNETVVGTLTVVRDPVDSNYDFQYKKRKSSDPDTAWLSTSLSGTKATTSFKLGEPIYIQLGFWNAKRVVATKTIYVQADLAKDGGSRLNYYGWYWPSLGKDVVGYITDEYRKPPMLQNLKEGSYVLTLTLDYTDAYSETDELNNIKTISFSVYDPTPKPTTYTIVFKTDGGSGTMASLSCAPNKVYALPRCAFTRSGSRFAGWRCSNGKRYDDGMLVFNLAEPGETVTMTAIWE